MVTTYPGVWLGLLVHAHYSGFTSRAPLLVTCHLLKV
jgi:hypothetical protein